MKTFTADEAKSNFDALIDQAQSGPVHVIGQDSMSCVMVSLKDYDSMRDFFVGRLLHTFGQTAKRAADQGLTAGVMATLLSDGM